MENRVTHIKAKGAPEWTSLYDHLDQVQKMAVKVANAIEWDTDICRAGAILHDIGKAHPWFQDRLNGKREGPMAFRHELASLFFLSLFDRSWHPYLIEMVVAHHKSIENDSSLRGLFDLIEDVGEEVLIEGYLTSWESWSEDALNILKALGVDVRPISREEAEANFTEAVEYADQCLDKQDYSLWRGVLKVADHLASGLESQTEQWIDRLFEKPDLGFFNRQSELYPLSLISTEDKRPHTMVVAPTGAGKTDYLMRRCRGRVFYTLPFQASINAMYERMKESLGEDCDVRLLHGASKVVASKEGVVTEMLQNQAGASVKVLTPHQLASMVFATKGFEAMMIDVMGQDVILDEVHVYSDFSRAMVLKIVKILDMLSCRIHIGTATMPTSLYQKIIEILGREKVLEVALDDSTLTLFDRHRLFRLEGWEDAEEMVTNALASGEKVLLVCNTVERAQACFDHFSEIAPMAETLLLHSRMKRGDRNDREKQLYCLNDKENTENGILVVSTQVVEVSLDISFDRMVTECAPLDAMVQRFGRIHRKRSRQTIGTYKPVFVVAPPEEDRACLPYNASIVRRSYEVLPKDGEVLSSVELQERMDKVYPDCEVIDIETNAVLQDDGRWTLGRLCDYPRSYFLDCLDIQSVVAITKEDIAAYESASLVDRMKMEIPLAYRYVASCRQLECGSSPFVINDEWYDATLGLRLDRIKEEKRNSKMFNEKVQIL